MNNSSKPDNNSVLKRQARVPSPLYWTGIVAALLILVMIVGALVDGTDRTPEVKSSPFRSVPTKQLSN